MRRGRMSGRGLSSCPEQESLVMRMEHELIARILQTVDAG
jgi:hypothetical protein